MAQAPVLVVSASAGTGHLRAGEALREALELAGVDAVHVDVLELAPRWVRAAYGGGFELVARRAPQLWRGIYRISDGGREDHARWGALAHGILFRSFERLLRSRPWAACVATHFLPAQLAAGRGAHGVPFSLVVTDFDLHCYWVQPRVRQYFTGSQGVAAALISRLAGADVQVTGIPIAPSFARAPRWGAARARLGLSGSDRVAVVAGGGLGIGIEQTALAALAARVPRLRVLAACGRNAAAAAALRARGVDPARLTVLDHVDDMATLLAASDVVVTKPGGLSTSEALAIGRPLILAGAIPGHEEANARYLAAEGAAQVAGSPAQVPVLLERLFQDPARWAAASAAARHLGRPHAAADVAAAVIRRYQHQAVA